MKYQKRIINIFAYIIFFEIFIYNLFAKLSTGGRWGTGIPLAAADRFLLNGGSLYSSIEEGILSSCTYFPGDVFLAIICRKLFQYNAETAMIVAGGIFFLIVAIVFVRMIASESWERIILGLCLVLFMSTEFGLLKCYLLETHPDVPAIAFFLLGFILSIKGLNISDKKKYIVVMVLSIICMALGGIFKQNSVFLYAGYGLFLIVDKEMPLKKRLMALTAEIISGFIVVANILLLDNCCLHTITVNSKHNLLGIIRYLAYGFSTCINNKIFVLCGLIFLILLITKNIYFENAYQRAWFYCSIVWFVFCMYGAMKDGANGGNMEAALIPLMPFVLLLIKKAIQLVTFVVDEDKLRLWLDGIKAKKLIMCIGMLAVLTVLLTGSLFILKKTGNYFSIYQERLVEQNTISEWINDKFKGKTVAISANNYEMYNYADVNISTDLSTEDFFDMAGLVTDEELNEISDEKQWDVVITIDAYRENKWPLTFEDYVLLDPSEYPTALPIFVYTRKE